jgi:polar amino acid transport system substrate-binding protein
MIRIIVAAAFALAAQAAAAQAPPDALKELAPTGKLRAAINYGNSVLAQKGPDGEPRGVSADLSRELAKRLGVPLEVVTFAAAGKAFEAAKENKVDVLFVAIEPVRAADVEFTPPYVLIEGAYLVLKDSPAREPADLDQPGKRIAVGENSAYDLYLTRTLKHAKLSRAEGGCCRNIDLFRTAQLDAVAGVRQPLNEYAKQHADVRVMEKPFQQIRQAMATPKGRTAAAAYLRTFIEEMKANGFVADALKRSNQPDAQVAPAGG